MSEFEGQIWIAQENDNVNFICTTKRVKNKIQALNEKGREQRFSEDKLLWRYAQQIKRPEDWQPTLSTLQSHVETLRTEIDIDLLWETASELDVDDISELADLYFGGTINPEHLTAIWCALADDRLYFKRRGKVWEARSATQIEELKLQREREQAREKAQLLAKEWLRKIIFNANYTEVEEELLPFVERLECWLRGDNDKFVNELVTQFANEAKVTPRELVFDILQKTERLPATADRDIIVAGLKPDFSAAITEAAQAIESWTPSTDDNAVTELLYSIDDEETQEVDDALGLNKTPEGWQLIIAISDPACVIHRGDSVDREAMRRGTTVYLPTQTVLMMPERISCDIASLTQQHLRSSVVLRIDINEEGELLNSQIQRETVKVGQRLHYPDADEMIATGTGDTADSLRNFHRIAQQLQAQRIAEGAFTFQRPEYKITVTNMQDVEVKMMETGSPSRLLVAEMMILANHVAAKYAQRHEVPIIYRTQDAPLEPITAEMCAAPLAFQKLRKLLRPSTLSLHAGGHSGLGLSAYTQLTSPLRRFADLVMQRQLVAHVTGEELPYDQDELFKVLGTAESTAREARMVENDAKKRWFALYLQQQWMDTPMPASVSAVLQNGYKVELKPWGFEAFLSATQALTLGEEVTVVIEKIRVKASNVRVKLASTSV